MENFLIVIIFIGSIVYKIYTNYKEETEKAKKRNPQHRPVVPTQQYNPPIEKEYIPQPIITETKNIPVQTPSYSSTVLPEEVRRVSEAKKASKLKPVVETSKQENQNITFDLRQAMIQSIILERPYKH